MSKEHPTVFNILITNMSMASSSSRFLLDRRTTHFLDTTQRTTRQRQTITQCRQCLTDSHHHDIFHLSDSQPHPLVLFETFDKVVLSPESSGSAASWVGVHLVLIAAHASRGKIATCRIRFQRQTRIGFAVANSLSLLRVQDEEARCALAYCLSFSCDESDFASKFAQLDSIMKRQLSYSSCFQRKTYAPVSLKQSSIDFEPLPRTLQDALRPNKSRAIVITETVAPFRVVDVNACWENLCGYKFVESKGKTLGALLKGPETNAVSATGLIAKLLQGESDAGTTLINYTKQGRRFRNRIRVGPLKDEGGNVTHFVGVLQEIHEGA
jgi:PAS domain S-box-containing protein